MTADQAALFDAPRHEGQGTLWGELYEAPAADDRCATCHRDAHRPGLENYGHHGHPYRAPGELDDQAAELARRVRQQRDKAAERHADVIEHRRNCGNCIPGHLCRDGRKAEKELRISRDVLRMIERGEL